MKSDKCRKCGQWRNNCDWKFNNEDICDPCYKQEWDEKYYDNCKQCSKREIKGFLKEHEGLCGICSGIVSDEYEECPTCGQEI